MTGRPLPKENMLDGGGIDSNSGVPDARIIQMLLLSERGRVLEYIQRHLPTRLSSLIDPQDVLQDAYFEAFCRVAQFVPSDNTSVYRWLVTIARNRIAVLIRSEQAIKRGGGAARADPGGSVVAMLAELAVYHRTPSKSTAAHELMIAVEQSLSRLPDDLQTAVRYRYLDGLSPAEIATKMDRTVRAVHQLCYRGIQQVRLDLRSASLFL
jgi:RNA polymerase sigma factor (sigma-70 family)